MQNNIIVIGAGISGLVASYELKKRGFEVTVLEKASNAGGRMQSEEIDGYIIDCGAQFLSSGYQIIPNLIKELDLDKSFIETSPYLGIIKNNKLKTFRYDNPFSLLFSGLLGLKDWFKLGFGGYGLKSKIQHLSLNDYSQWSEFDNDDGKSWSDTFYTKEIGDYFFEPMIEAFYFQSLKQTSKALLIALTKFNLDGAKTKTLKNGIGILTKTLAKELDIRYNTTVTDISFSDEKVTILTNLDSFEADKVIITTPAPMTKAFYKTQNLYEKKLLNIPYSSTINIAIALNKKLSQKEFTNIYGIWIPKKERDNIAAITIESSKSQDRATKGELLHIMLSGEAGKKLIDKEDNEILLVVLNEMKKYNLDIQNNIEFTKLYRWKFAEPLSYIGRAKDIKEYKENIKNNTKIYLAGDYMSMPFTEGAAQSSQWVTIQI